MRNDTDSYVYKTPTDDSSTVSTIVGVAVVAFIFGLLAGFSL